MTYTGSCHCGGIKFEVAGEIDTVMECNCSICAKRGHLLWFVPRDKVKLSMPEENLATYMFNKKAIRHHFCPVCGCAPLGFGVEMPMAAVNVRCLDGVDASKFQVTHYDGRSK